MESRFDDLSAIEPEADLFDRLRAAESIGRPLGGDRFLARAERPTGRPQAAQARAEALGGGGRLMGGVMSALSP